MTHLSPNALSRPASLQAFMFDTSTLCVAASGSCQIHSELMFPWPGADSQLESSGACLIHLHLS